MVKKQLERIGVIGDIHAEHVLLERALDVLAARNVDVVVATGDVADGAGSVDACCELLISRGVVTVGGNHDRWLLGGSARTLPEATVLAAVSKRSQQFLERLPRMVELSTVRGLALLCHGIGPNDMAKVGPDDVGDDLESNDDLQDLVQSRYFRWVINGHSHRRMVRAFPGFAMINAGTLKRDHSPCFLEIDFPKAVVTVFEIDAAGAITSSPATIPLPDCS